MKFDEELEYYNRIGIENLPDIETLRFYLEDFDKALLSCRNVMDFYAAYKRINFFPFMIDSFSSSDFDKMPFYRARKDINELINPTILTSTFSYPYSHFCKEAGRANVAGIPVLYAGDNIYTAMLESRPSDDTDFFITKWFFKPDRDVKFATFFHHTTRTENVWRNVLESRDGSKRDYRFQFPHKVGQLNLLNDYWAEKFLYEEPPYPATSNLSHLLLYMMEMVDFIVYPSKANNQLSTNFAFHANFVDRFGAIDTAVCINLKKQEEKKFHWQFTKVGEVHVNSLRWRKFNQETDYDNLAQAFRIVLKK